MILGYSRVEIAKDARLYGGSRGISLRARYNEADVVRSTRLKGKKMSIIDKKYKINEIISGICCVINIIPILKKGNKYRHFFYE